MRASIRMESPARILTPMSEEASSDKRTLETNRYIFWRRTILFLALVGAYFMVAGSFFGSAVYTVVGPYMAEIWPARLRASGMGLSYGVGNCGKFLQVVRIARSMCKRGTSPCIRGRCWRRCASCTMPRGW